MAFLKSLLIGGYTAATKPWRQWMRNRLAREGKLPVTGLFLHRIADEYPNDWTLSVDRFGKLLNWLQDHVDLVSAEEAQRRIIAGNRGRIAVNLSFDDGYADNCLHAIPALLSRKIPFTYFVTTHNVRYGKPFPHDVRMGQPLAPNSIDEIKALADAGVEIGVHTRTHANLGSIARVDELHAEIVGARDDIERWIGSTPRYFAFPYGLPPNLNPQAIQLIFDEHFHGYCSAYGGYNWPGTQCFHLLRFHADPDLTRVKNWLTLDPRWVRAKSEERSPQVLDVQTTTNIQSLSKLN
jgi:peptidoglycan/xylan/chitin deacetylase (PgdA/CDA1 family)